MATKQNMGIKLPGWLKLSPTHKYLVIIPLILLAVVTIFSLGQLVYFSFLSGGLFSRSPAAKPVTTTTAAPVVAEPIIPLKAYPENLQSGPFACPTIKSICQSGTYTENTLSGNIPSKAPIFAAFDGLVTILYPVHPNTDGTKEGFNSIVLVSKDKGLVAFYSFKGKTIDNKEVKEGEKIATSSGEMIKFRDNKSFIFELLKYQEQGATKSALTSKDFKL